MMLREVEVWVADEPLTPFQLPSTQEDVVDQVAYTFQRDSKFFRFGVDHIDVFQKHIDAVRRVECERGWFDDPICCLTQRTDEHLHHPSVYNLNERFDVVVRVFMKRSVKI